MTRPDAAPLEADPEAFLIMLQERDHAVGVSAVALNDSLRVARLLEEIDRYAARGERMLARVAELERQLADSRREVSTLRERLQGDDLTAPDLSECRAALADREAQLDALRRSRAFKVAQMYWRGSRVLRRKRS